MSDTEFDFSVIEEAGLTQAEFAELAEVSRVTVNLWVQKKCLPARKKETRIKSLLKVLSAAIRRGMLPGTLPTARKANMDDRRTLIRKTIRAIVRSRKS